MTEIDAPFLPDFTLYFHQSFLLCDASNLFIHRTLRCVYRPQEGAKGRGSRRMFWELAPKDLIDMPADLSCAKVERAWKRRKNKMEKISRSFSTANENTPRAVQLREYILEEFWDIFVNDGLLGAEALIRHVHVQSEAVFSYAMTMMDKIEGWEEEERRVGSEFATCMWIYTKKIIDCLKKRMMSITFCTNWVCAVTFVDEVIGMELDLKIGIPCMVQWCMLLFSASIRLNRTLERQDRKIVKYHGVVNMAIAGSISRRLGGEHTPRSCMLASVAKILHRKRESEQRDGRMDDKRES